MITPSCLLGRCISMRRASFVSAMVGLLFSGLIQPAFAFVHPGLLHTTADFSRMTTKVNASAQPWKSSWDLLVANTHSSLSYTPSPVAIVYRGSDGVHAENYSKLFNDCAAAYATALRWKITGDAAYAEKSIAIMNAWSSTLTTISGTSDKFLAAGLYGYEFANAAEIMRSYSGWAPADFTRFKNMMLTIFYPMNHDFLVNHNANPCIAHYWANWDLCNMAAILATGVLCDDTAKYNEAINYFKTGGGNGSINNVVFYLHPGNLGQCQESGRDQGHTCLDVGLLGSFCKMALAQGDDLFSYNNNRCLAMCEYIAQYNLGNSVPYTTYSNCDVTQTVISPTARGDLRPTWELIYNHYANVMGVAAPNSAAYAELVRPEGGGGNYGPNSGGYDQLGYGTLTCTIDPGLPAPWKHADIGTVNTAGSATLSGGVFTVAGSGTDIGGTGDGAQFVYKSLSGNGSLIARLATRTIGGTANDKVGITMRASTASDATMVTMLLDATSGKARFASRAATGGATTWVDGAVVAVPEWFKLQRTGNTFTGFVSADGTTWTQLGSVSITMSTGIQIGMIVCSRDTALDTSTFDNVQ